jgi:site-specific recombinase XerD
MTWTAQQIHFLTRLGRRALSRVITRKRDRALFLVAYRHGLRASAVGLWHVDDLNLAQQRMTIHRVRRSLSGVCPLRAGEVTALKAHLRERKSPAPARFLSQRGTPVSRRPLDALMQHDGEPAGIPASKRHSHVLKHSIATHLLDAGADLRLVQDWVGQASVKNAVIYAQLTSRRRDEEARRVFTGPSVV